ncbi:hypothetical protein KY345_00535 [Candidatus Woesearchaeota archaeon]|nr:hypothetical protein [Candidatus Woesearchaeota archaeon]
MKNIYLIIICVILLAGCGPSCPKCPEPGSYSECSDQAVKTRTNYRCSEATDFECESYSEEAQCSTEIKMQGNLDAIIKPSVEEKVKGIIKIEVRGVPEGTKNVLYWMEGGDLVPVGPERGPSIASEQDGVWTAMIDTAQYKNGLYSVKAASTERETVKEGDTPPTAFAQGQMVISN